MNYPGLTLRGQPISADDLNRINRAGVSGLVQPSPGSLTQRLPNGTLIRPRRYESLPSFGGSRGHPFKLRNASDATPAARVAVTFGQVQSVTPTISTVALDNATPPLITLANGSWVIYLHVLLDGTGLIDEVTIESGSAIPANDVDNGYLTIGNVVVASNAVTAMYQSVTHSLGYQKCGDEVHNFWGI